MPRRAGGLVGKWWRGRKFKTEVLKRKEAIPHALASISIAAPTSRSHEPQTFCFTGSLNPGATVSALTEGKLDFSTLALARVCVVKQRFYGCR